VKIEGSDVGEAKELTQQKSWDGMCEQEFEEGDKKGGGGENWGLEIQSNKNALKGTSQIKKKQNWGRRVKIREIGEKKEMGGTLVVPPIPTNLKESTTKLKALCAELSSRTPEAVHTIGGKTNKKKKKALKKGACFNVG